MYNKIEAGKYTFLINNTLYTVQKISKRKWYLILDDRVINEGTTRGQAAGYTPNNKISSVQSSVSAPSEQPEQPEQPEGIHPECIQHIKPEAMPYWIQNCISLSTLQQLSIIIDDNPSLFGEIVEYCIGDIDQYYRYLINIIRIPESITTPIQCIHAATAATLILLYGTDNNYLLNTVRQAAQDALSTKDTEVYDSLYALYMAGTRSTNAAYYAIKAGVPQDDIINKVIELMNTQ
jgi:hypothetical protein